MAVDPISVIVGLLLLFFLPGYMLLHALFPGRRYFGPFHPFALPALGVVVSVAILVLVGTLLGFLPGGPNGMGWFQGGKTGAPVLEISLAAISAALFGLAWWRGSFPLLGRKREDEPPVERGEPEDVTLLRDLRLEEERLRKEAKRIRRRAGESRDVGVRSALQEAATDLDEERGDVAKRAEQLERRAGERRYGRTAEQKDPRSRIRKP